MNKQKLRLTKKQKLELIVIFAGTALGVFAITMLCTSLATYFIVKTGALFIVPKNVPGAGKLIIFMAVSSVILSFFIILVSGRLLMRPVNRLISGMNSMASGDYSVRMEIGKPFGDYSVMRNVSDSFNAMALELENTEVLRSDFINNFSHEFKTPIVSIAGFAKLLKKGKLTEAQRAEYINIIEEEALRLSAMATNVLNLTKVENQTILTDVSTYNLSEQLRTCLLLLESKWTKKNLELHIDFKEYIISGNEELLKQAWINLADNAIKFSPDYGILEIKIREENGFVFVSFSNNGNKISPEAQKRIFNKFYQEDESHSKEGNGIGLAIVKRIAELHGGEVYVESVQNLTTFTVKLAKYGN